jgi:acetyl-CoA carboxylase biotin carboxyl carrier protein
MDLNLIKKLIKVVDSSEITDLEVEQDGLRIKIAKKIRAAQAAPQPQFVSMAPLTADSSHKTSETKPGAEEKSENYHEIRSPIVGTFYRAPGPDADPYVQVGDSVSSGTVLCIVEAMKLMNEIESDVNGKIIKILAENGKPVEFNQPLFLIQVN